MTMRTKRLGGTVLGAALAGLLLAAPVSAQEVKQDAPPPKQDRAQHKTDRKQVAADPQDKGAAHQTKRDRRQKTPAPAPSQAQ